MSYAIGVDLGGTRIKLIVVSPDGAVITKKIDQTADVGDASWADKIKKMISEAEREQGKTAGAVGLAAPGLAARNFRSIISMPGRLEGLEHLDWTEFLGREKISTMLNDAHAALIGEHWLGAARNYDDAILLTLGTGVGGAILSNGKLMTGHIGRAGHLGHICLDKSGEPDNVNTPGSIESMIGEHSIPQRTRGLFPSSKKLVEAHLAGHKRATEIWLESVHALACAITSFVNILDPEAVIVGGGIAQADDALFKPLAKYMGEMEWRPDGHKVKILPAELNDWAGAFGAARFAMTFEQ